MARNTIIKSKTTDKLGEKYLQHTPQTKRLIILLYKEFLKIDKQQTTQYNKWVKHKTRQFTHRDTQTHRHTHTHTHTHTHLLTLSAERCRSNDTPVAMSTPSAQFLVSKYLAPMKAIRDPRGNG